MNRNHHLEQSLPTWIGAKPDEIVILDWGSQPPIKPIVDKYIVDASGLNNTNKETNKETNKKTNITLITITNADKWVLTKSFNLAARFTKYKHILKVDCDSLLKEDFFSSQPGERRRVFRG